MVKKQPKVKNKEAKVYMPPALHKKIRLIAAEEDMSFSAVVVDAVRAYKNEWAGERNRSGEGVPWTTKKKTTSTESAKKLKSTASKPSKKKPKGKPL